MQKTDRSWKNRAIRFVAPLLVLGFSLPSGAAETKPARSDAYWEAHCSMAGESFRLTFASASGDPFEDDMSVVAHFGDGSQLTLPLAPQLYVPSQTKGKTPDLCRGVVGVPMAGNRILLFVSSDGRPGYDFSNAVLLDPAARRAIDVKQHLGELKRNALAIRPVNDTTVDVRIVRHSLGTCDCDAALVEGWLRVSVAADRLRTRWAPK